jgi:hypothetical protein
MPPPGMVRNSGPYFDQTLNQPVNGSLNLFDPDIVLPDHRLYPEVIICR